MTNETNNQAQAEAQVEAGEATQTEAGEPEAEATVETVAPAKAKRKILNPQPIIDAKVELFAEAGGSIEWKNRLWVVSLDGNVVVMDSHEFAEYKPAELLVVMGMLGKGEVVDSTNEAEPEAEESTSDEAEEETSEA